MKRFLKICARFFFIGLLFVIPIIFSLSTIYGRIMFVGTIFALCFVDIIGFFIFLWCFAIGMDFDYKLFRKEFSLSFVLLQNIKKLFSLKG